MRSRPRHRRLLLTLALSLAAASCARRPEFPITEHARPFTSLNERMAHVAPPVVTRVTFERLVRAREEPHNWLTYYGAYDGQRYSTLDQITTDNVRELRPAWSFQYGLIGLVATPATYSFQATPIVVDGVMFVTGPDGYVWALDAATGDMLWQYQHAVPIDVPLCCGNNNRGVAVARGKVFFVTLNGRLVALDATNGRWVWEQAFADPRAGESATLAPLVVKDMVIVGNSGGEYGVRGHIDAFDLESGRRVWRRYTIPAPGEPGSETWPRDTDAWARGGGTAWITGTYDPELDLMYWGIANPGPVFDGSVRPGDNLYTSSIVALRPDDGSMAWYYQMTPHDVWDYDGVNENILFEQDGRRLLAHFDKNGYLYILDRTDGSFVRAARFARVTWGQVDPATGRRTVERVPTREGTEICPGPAGAKEWPHAAYSPRTGLLYTPVVELCATFTTSPDEFLESLPYWGSAAQTFSREQFGYVKAFDSRTGREIWSRRTPHPMVGSALATAGDLLFIGEPNGMFNAFDARSGRVLWQYQTGSGIRGGPVTYSVDGKQYVAIPSGWGGWIEGFAPELYGAPRGMTLYAFALP